jgi:hypothetical protein
MDGYLDNNTHKNFHPLNIEDQKEKGINQSLKTEGKIRL